MTSSAIAPSQRPALRGAFHLGAAIDAIAGAVLLVLLANSARAYVGGAVFAASLILLYTVSAAYHQITWTPRLRGISGDECAGEVDEWAQFLGSEWRGSPWSGVAKGEEPVDA